MLCSSCTANVFFEIPNDDQTDWLAHPFPPLFFKTLSSLFTPAIRYHTTIDASLRDCGIETSLQPVGTLLGEIHSTAFDALVLFECRALLYELRFFGPRGLLVLFDAFLCGSLDFTVQSLFLPARAPFSCQHSMLRSN